MRKIISNIKDRIEDGLRRICAPMGPGTRILVIAILATVFAVANFYIMFQAIYNIGREENEKRELIDSGIKVPGFEPEHTKPDEKPERPQKETEEFYYKHFNSEKNDTTGKR
jgi:hypothetical protein